MPLARLSISGSKVFYTSLPITGDFQGPTVSTLEGVAPCYLAFCHVAVTARRAVSPAASEAPSDPKDRTDRCTSSLPFQIAQSNRPGSLVDGVTRRE
jgi:hypothetical protein